MNKASARRLSVSTATDGTRWSVAAQTRRLADYPPALSFIKIGLIPMLSTIVTG